MAKKGNNRQQKGGNKGHHKQIQREVPHKRGRGRAQTNDRRTNDKRTNDRRPGKSQENFREKSKQGKKWGGDKGKKQDLKTNNGVHKKNKNQIVDPMNPLKSLQKLTGNSAFKIMPESMRDDQDDKFAALGGQSQQEQEQYEQQMEDEEVMDEQQGQQDMQQGEQQIQEEDQVDIEEGDEADQFSDDDEQIEEDQYADQDQRDGEVQGEFEDEMQGQQMQQKIEEQDEDNVKLEGQEEEDMKNVDISVINLKIQETISVLMNVARLGQGKPRKYFIAKLKQYIHQYYGYNFQLIDHFLNFLNPTEMIQFFEANETQRPLTIRTNTLKTRRKDLAQALIQRGVNLDPLAEWSKVGIKIYESKVPIGATPEYLAGYYMLQSASSFLPVLALDPQMGEKVLDLAAAPGGKTSYIAQLMKNTGCVFANDLKKQRLRALQFNLFRLGITNTIVTCRDGRKYSKIFPNTFDRVLLDSPCTGLGIISKDMSIKANRTLIDIYKNSHVQKQLILSAIDSTKVGGIIVYSTCSVSPLQNQQVVNFALKKRHVKIVDVDDLVQVGEIGLTKFIDKRYHIDLRKTKRIYPHVHNMDGFYLAKLVKIANGKKVEPKTEKQTKNEQE